MVLTTEDGLGVVKCRACEKPAQVVMWGYAASEANIEVCEFHAKQLARKLLEDVCHLAGDRHG